MNLAFFVDYQIARLEIINSPEWRAPGEPRRISGNEIEEKHFKPQRRATRKIVRTTVSAIFDCEENDPHLIDVLETISESRWRLHFQVAFYQAKMRLENEH